MVNSNSKNQTKVGESYSQYRLAKKHGDGSKIAKRAALVCSIAMLVIIFFVYIFGSLGGGYKEGTLFSHELIAVQNNDGKWGYLNKTGQIMIDFEYDNALNFTENGLALVSKDGKWGFIDINGKMAISADYEEAMPFKYGVAIVKKDGKYGFIDGKGNVISKDPVSKTAGFCYSTIYDFEQEYSSKKIYAIAGYEVENEVKYGVIDNGGNVVIDFAYEELGYADENVGESKRIGNGLISYKIGGSWGYMTYEGVTKTSAIYDRAYAFDENKMAIVEATVGADGYFTPMMRQMCPSLTGLKMDITEF